MKDSQLLGSSAFWISLHPSLRLKRIHIGGEKDGEQGWEKRSSLQVQEGAAGRDWVEIDEILNLSANT